MASRKGAKRKKEDRVRFVDPRDADHLFRLRRDGGLPATTFVVGLAVASFADPASRTCYPSRAAIAARAGIDVRNVSLHLRRLEAVGFLRTQHLPGRPSVYSVRPGRSGGDP